MNLDSCILIGHIVKAHGFKGEVNAEIHFNLPKKFKLESVYLEINQKLVPFFIEKISLSNQKAIIKFEDVDSEEEVKKLLKKSLYLPAEKLPEQEEYDPSLDHIIGFKVKDKTLGELGLVVNIFERAGQDLLMMEYEGKEVMIPVDENIILKVEAKKKLITVNLPEGLLDL